MNGGQPYTTENVTMKMRNVTMRGRRSRRTAFRADFLRWRAWLFFCILLPTLAMFRAAAQEEAQSGPPPPEKDNFGWIAYPYVFYSPESNLAFGAGGFVYFRFSPDTTIKPSSITPSAYYSINDQFDITIIPEFYIGRRLYIYSYVSFGEYIDKFYGIGPHTAEIDSPEYDHRNIVVELNIQPQISETFRAGLYSRLLDRSVLSKRGNPFLSSGTVKGAEGGLSIGLGGVVAWDTRDHRFYPSRGILNEISAVFYSKTWGSDFDYNKYEVDLRGYHPLGEGDRHILGLQFLGSVATSGAPFYDVSLLGGQTIMRGYYLGRFRDRALLAGQVEYRTRAFWRIGVVAFAGAGQVAPEIGALSLRDLLPTYGFGLRYQFDTREKIDLRVDVGFGKNTTGVYFNVQQAF